MPPAVGALLMSISTIVVALNAQLVHRLDLKPAAQTAPSRAALPAMRPTA
jgi:Cu2+-exporting ATPase